MVTVYLTYPGYSDERERMNGVFFSFRNCPPPPTIDNHSEWERLSWWAESVEVGQKPELLNWQLVFYVKVYQSIYISVVGGFAISSNDKKTELFFLFFPYINGNS